MSSGGVLSQDFTSLEILQKIQKDLQDHNIETPTSRSSDVV